MGQDKQYEEIVAYYKDLLDEAAKAKTEAQVQVDLTEAKLRSLEAERDALQTALKNADERIRKLEMERAAVNEPQVAPAEAPEAAPEAAPVVTPEVTPAEEPVVTPEVMPAEEPAEAPQIPPYAMQQFQMPEEAAPVEQPAEVDPDFEQQKEVLRRMEEELAALEAKLKEGS